MSEKPTNIYHTVRAGENIESLAFYYGHFSDVIWNHPNNASLKDLRRDPDVLEIGDQVFIPSLRLKTVAGATNQVHRFQCKNTPSLFRFRPLVFGEPLIGEKYVLVIDDEMTIEGSIGENGTITHSVRPDAKRARLTVGSGVMEFKYYLDLRTLPPVDTVLGIQARLQQMGIYNGELDGKDNPETQSALAVFQERQGLEPTGKIDEKTKQKLLKHHGR